MIDEKDLTEIIPEKEIENKIYNMPKLFYEWCKEAAVHTPINYEFDHRNSKCKVYTTSPGPLIGMKGERVDRYNKELQKLYTGYTFEFVPLRGMWVNYLIPGKKKKRF